MIINIQKFFLSPYIKLLRPQQWIKSFFVLLGLIYSHSLDKTEEAMLAFVAFSFAASTVYIYNDIHDRKADSFHPDKCKRPIASGELTTKNAGWFLLGMFLLTSLVSLCVSLKLYTIILTYWAINFSYNLCLKKLPIFDVFSVASGFVLRMLAGTFGIGLPYSRWLLVSVTFLSLLIAFSKRYLEKKRTQQHFVRQVLNYYSNSILKKLIIINALFALTSYFVYILAVHQGNFFYLLTMIFALLGMVRYTNVIFKFYIQEDDPILVIIGDRKILVFFLGFAICTLLAFLWT